MSVLSLIGLVQVSGTLVLDSAGKLALLPDGATPRPGDVIIDILDNAEIGDDLSVQFVSEDNTAQEIDVADLDVEQIIAQVEEGADPTQSEEQAPAAGEASSSSPTLSGNIIRDDTQTIAQTQFDTSGLEAQGLSNTQSLTLLQFLANSAPVVFNNSRTFDEESQDNLLAITLPTDANNDVLTIRITNIPALGTVTLGDGSKVSVGDELTLNELANLQYDAPLDYNEGEEAGSLGYSVDDGRDAPNSLQSADVEITINEVNDAPVAFDDDVETDEDSVLSATLPDATDVDGTIASYALQDDVPADKGSLTFNSNGSYSFDPGEDFQGLSNGDSEDVTFTYIALDNEGLASAPQTITITVTGINDKPVALPADEMTDEDTSISRNVPEASDIDGTIASYALQSDVPADKGSLTFNADGSYSFDPGEDFQGLSNGDSEDVTFTYIALDNEGLASEPQTITITVTGINDKPVALPADEMTDEDTSINRNVPEASDIDGTVASYALQDDVPADKGSLTFNADGSYSFDPGEDFQSLSNGDSEDVTFTYIALDNEGLASEPQTITITVTGINDKPVALPADEMTDEDTSISRNVPEASDIDGTVASYALQDDVPADKGSLTFNSDGSYSFDPGEDFQGLSNGDSEDVTFTYIALDDEGLASAPQTITITVTGINDKPVALPADEMTDEDTSISRSVPEASDIDGTIASYALQDDVPADKGSLTFNADGSYSFDPGEDFQGLSNGDSEDVTFTYIALDNEGLASEPQTITITVTGINDKPVALPADEMTDEDTSISRNVPEASDIDGTIASYALQDDVPADKGSLTFNSDGSYSFDPGEDFQGLSNGDSEDVTFTYIALDDEGLASEPQTITITVTGINDKPVALPADEMTDEDTSINRNVPEASDIDGTIASYALQDDVPADKGSLTFNSDGSYSFDPGEDFQGLSNGDSEDVTFTYIALDDEGLASEPQTITITVTGINDKPVALPADEMTDEDTSINRNVPEASDIDGTIASYALQDDVPADKGSLTFNSDGSYSFDPGEDFQGLSNGDSEDVTFTYIALDDEGLASAPQTITITVTGINDKPVALPADEMTDEDTSISRNVPEASDIDGTVASYALQDDVPADKGSLTFNADGSYSFDPGEDFQGLSNGDSEDVTFTYIALDDEGLASEPQTITITVTGINDKPVALPADEMTDEDTSISRNVPEASDIDGTIASYALQDDVPADKGSLTFNSDGSYSFDPGEDFQGLSNGDSEDVTFTYIALDNEGLASAPQTITITVTGINDKPVALPADEMTDEDTSISRNVPEASDIDGTIASYALQDDVPADKGSLTFNSDGSYSFDPGEDFQGLSNGDSEDVTFTYIALDDEGLASAPQTITITVTGINDKPVALPADEMTDEDTSINRNVPEASDIDGTIASYALQDDVPADKGSLTFNADGSYSFDPGEDFQSLTSGESEVVEFTYYAVDNEGSLSEPQTVSITVHGLNDDPESEDFAITVTNGAATPIYFDTGEGPIEGGGSDHISDNEDDRSTTDSKALSIVITELPIGGTLLYNDGVSVREIVEADLHVEGAVEGTPFDPNNISYLPDDSAQGFTLGIKDPQGLAEEESSQSDFLNWGEPGNTPAERVLTVGDDTITITSSGGDLTQYRGDPGANHVGFGLGVGGGKGINQGETITIDFSDRPATSISLGLDGLGGFFNENLNNSNESSVLISVTLSDGSTVELDPYQKNTSGNGDLDFDLSISIADIPGAEGLLIEAVTVGTEGNGNWELRYLETSLDDSFDYRALDSDGAYSEESTVTIDDQRSNQNPDAMDDPESYILIQGDMGSGDQGWSGVESIVAKYDGETVSYSIDGSDRIGIPDGTTNAGPESQIQHNRDEEASEQLIITLKEPAVDGAFSVTNLFANEGGVGSHEQGKWSAYLGGTLVASDHFYNDSGHKGSFDIETNGSAFDTLVFESVDFTGGPARGTDSSDYFLQGIQIVGAGAYVFDHDEPVVIPLSEILSNDSDVDGDSVRITYVFGETEGDARIEGDNVIFDLPEDFSGRTEFQYQITDDKGGFDTATVNVLVNPAPIGVGSVELNLDADSVIEGENLSYLVTLDGTTNVKTFFDIEFGTSGDTASINDVDPSSMTFSHGVSYNAVSGELEVPEGVDEFTVSLPTVNDDRYEGDESFTLLIDGQSAAGSILDNDPISLSLSGGGEVSEDAGSIGFELELSHASDVPLTIALSRLDTDTNSDDFGTTTATYNNGNADVPLVIVNGEIEIPVGVTSIDINVGILDDEHYEQDEDFTLKITEPAGLTTNGVVGVTADATISDDGEIGGVPSGDNDNNAPTLDLDGSEGGSGYTATFTEGDTPIMVVDSDIVITDDIDVISKAEIRLTNPQPNDSLSLNGVLPTGLSITTSTVGGALLLTISGEANADVYEAALKQLEFENDSEDPNTEPREIEVTVFDDQDLASNVAISTIDVISVNSPPESEDFSFTISGNDPVGVSFDTGVGSIEGAGSDHISDIEDDINGEQVNVKITELPIGGSLYYDGVEITQTQVDNGDNFDPTKITYQANEDAQGFILGTRVIPTDSDLESTQETFYNWGDEVDNKNRSLELENGDAVTISSNRGNLTQYRGDMQDNHVGHGIGIGGGQGINQGELLSIGFADRPATHINLGLDGMGGYFYSGLGDSNESAVTIQVMLSDGSTVDYIPDVQKDTSGNEELFHELSFSVDDLNIEEGVLITGVSVGTDGPGNWELRYLETALNDRFTYQAVDSDGAESEESVVTIADERINNAAPILDLDASEAGTGFASVFTEGDSAIGVVDNDVDVFDENNIISLAEVILTNPHSGDSFSVVASSNPLLSGIAYSSETLGSGAIKISLYGNASADDYEAALKLIQFANDSQIPDLTNRVIEITTFDEQSLPSNTAISTIEMVSVLDVVAAPAIGNEDSKIALAISLPTGSDATKVEISGIPDGAKIYDGINELTVVDNAVMLNELQLAQLFIQPGLHSDVDFSLQVDALDSADLLVEQTTVEVTVKPVTDLPVLSVSGEVILASIDFENVSLGGSSWRGNVSDTELNANGSTGIWGTENSSSVSEVGREGVYLGNQSQDKDNHIFEIEGRRNTDDSLFTDFEGKAGAFYHLTFDIAARQVNGSPVKVFLVDDQDVRSELYEFDDSVDRAWNSESIVFQTPESGNYRLLFESEQVDSYGALLDNISLSTRNNYGYEDSYIDISDIAASLIDVDGSESLSLVLKGLPEGSIVTNGIQTLEVGVSLEADVSQWQNLEALQVLVDDVGVYPITIEATSSENDSTHPTTDQTVSEVINLTVVPNPNVVPNTEPSVTDFEFFAEDDTIPLNFSEWVTDLEDDASDVKQTFVKIEGEPEFGQLYFLSGSGDRFDLDSGDLVEDSVDVYYDIDVGFDATTAEYESDLTALLEQGLAISGGTYGGSQPHVNSELESIAFDGAGAAKQRGYYTKRADENGQGKETEAQEKEYMSIKFTAGLMTRALVGVGSLTGQFSASANGGGQSNIFVYLYAGGDLVSNTPVQMNNDTIVDHQATISVSSEQGFDEMRIVAVDGNDKKAGFVLQSVEVVDAEVADQFEYSAVDSDGLASVETATVDVNIVPNGNVLDAESVDYAVQGGNGVTVITGTDGDDLIIGGQGSDVLTGGLGDDTFKWTESDLDGSHDVITDFSQEAGNRDVIDFVDLFDDDDTLQSLLDNNTIAVTEEDGNTLINIDKGNGKTVTIELEGVTGVDNSILSNIVIIHDS